MTCVSFGQPARAFDCKTAIALAGLTDTDFNLDAFYKLSHDLNSISDPKKRKAAEKELFCMAYKSPHYQKLSGKLEEVIQSRREQIARTLSSCGMTIPYFSAWSQFYVYQDQKISDDDRDFVTEHGPNAVDNFLFGSFIQCGFTQTKMAPHSLRWVVGLLIANNAWEESVEAHESLGLQIWDKDGEFPAPDHKDITTGTAGALAYFLSVKISEKALKMSPQKFCL